MWSILVSKNSSSSTQSIFDGLRTQFPLSLELLLPELLLPSLLWELTPLNTDEFLTVARVNILFISNWIMQYVCIDA